MTSLEIILIISQLAVVGLIIYSQTRKSGESERVIRQTLDLSSEHFTKTNQQFLQTEGQLIAKELSHSREQFARLTDQLLDSIEKRQASIQKFEQNRVESFTALAEMIKQQTKLTGDLSDSTHSLSRLLSNNQQRGYWGERIIEDILKNSGLIEGTHYLFQSKLGTGQDRPDVTLILPNSRQVPLDVKFPLSELIKAGDAQTQSQRQVHFRQFEQDVKSSLVKVSKYIKPEQKTLDYALMFIPNESIFGALNRDYPHLIDLAFELKVLIVSPFTLMIVVRTIFESYRNFMFESNIRELVGQLRQFAAIYSQFQTDFEFLGKKLDSTQAVYQKIAKQRLIELSLSLKKVHQLQE